MASYPNSTYSPRAKENRAGVVYDASKKTVGYVEDVTKLDDEVVAIETDLLNGGRPKRVTSETSSGTPTINTDNADVHRITALAENITSMTTNLSGTPTLWQLLAIEIIGTAARDITWGASFENGGLINLPVITDGTTPLKILVQWNGAKWSCLAVA